VKITNQDLKNKFVIYKLVKNHFGLTNESLKLFKYRLFDNPHIAPEYKKLLYESPDPLRLRVPLEVDNDYIKLERLDNGWSLFVDTFRRFINDYNVSYSDFRNNRVTMNKQEVKLQKALNMYYKENNRNSRCSSWDDLHTPQCIKKHMEQIGAKTLSKTGGLQLVLSLNFADWLLCSTAETWTSCLNLNSSYDTTFWAGLPGLIGDKNRSMLYLTDGQKKNYEGIIVDKVLSRTWVLTVREKSKIKDIVRRGPTHLHRVAEYPGRMDLGKMAEELMGINWHNKGRYDDKSFLSRYYIENLFHRKEGGSTVSSFIYQDTTSNKIAKKNKGKFFPGSYCYLTSGGGGVTRYDREGNETGNNPFYYTAGLSHLIRNNISLNSRNLSDYDDESYYCCECDESVYDGDAWYDEDGNTYCRACYEEYFVECESCNEYRATDDMNEATSRNHNAIIVCDRCLGRYYSYCDVCDGYHHHDNVQTVENTNEAICNNCVSENTDYIICSDCDEIYDKAKSLSEKDIVLNKETDEYQCKSCIKEAIKLEERRKEKKIAEQERIEKLNLAKDPIQNKLSFKDLVETPIHSPEVNSYIKYIQNVSSSYNFGASDNLTELMKMSQGYGVNFETVRQLEAASRKDDEEKTG